MSVKIMGKVWDMELPANEKFVLLALADHADHDGGNIYPGIKRISDKTGFSVRNVTRIISTLKDKGILVPTSNETGGRGQTTVFRIEFKKDDKLSGFSEDKTMPDCQGLPEQNHAKSGIETMPDSTENHAKFDESHDKERARLVNRPLTVMEPSYNNMGAPESEGPAIPDPFEHWAVVLFQQELKVKPHVPGAELIASRVKDSSVWLRVLDIWKGNRHIIEKIGNIVDRYQKEFAKQKNRPQGRASQAQNPSPDGWREHYRKFLKKQLEYAEDESIRKAIEGVLLDLPTLTLEQWEERRDLLLDLGLEIV